MHSSLEKLERLTWTFRLPYEVDMQRAQMWAHRTPEGYTEDGIATYPARWEELYFTEEKYPLEDFASLRAPPLESRQNLVRRIHSALPQAQIRKGSVRRLLTYARTTWNSLSSINKPVRG
ncbi:hypothetical protein ACFSC4_31160 [Deinococcus malanensis]|uniref:hypothetical protein n=1 Tax=Deinococcus malanensis TaxID=1706855 RepID=UPI00364565B0